jgi:hypothetical protein
MPLGPTIELNLSAPPKSSHSTYPASVVGAWATAIDAGGLDAAESDIARPDLISDSTRKIILPFKNCGGTSLVFAVRYASGNTANTGGSYAVWGRKYGAETEWTRIANRAGDIVGVPTFATATDPSNGTFKITVSSATGDVWDAMGFDEFIVGVVAAYSCTGDANAASLLVKAI